MQKILIFVGIVLVVALGCILAAKSVLERKIFGRMTPEMKAEFESWYKTDVNIPLDAQIVEPFAPETAVAARAYRAAWREHKDAATALASEADGIWRSGGDLDVNSPDMLALYAKLEPCAPLVDSFETLVARPDYELDALVAGLEKDPVDPDNPNVYLVPNFLAYQVSVKLLRLQAYQELSQGQPAEALQTCETIIRSAKAHPYSYLITRLISIAGGSIGTRAWHDAVTRVNDPALLRQTLAAQTSLSPRPILIDYEINLAATDQFGSLRQMKRLGMDVNMTGMTGRELMAESIRLQKIYLENFAMPRMKNNPEQLAELKKQMDAEAPFSMTVIAGRHPLIPGFADRLGAAALYLTAMPNFDEAHTRDTTYRATFEVLRAETARRLAAIESGAEPDSVAALAPAWLPEEPVDYFAAADQEKASLQRAEEGFAYSIGPDGVDDKAALRYDPTNGTISPGDIYLARAH